jgi:hypothetical protein
VVHDDHATAGEHPGVSHSPTQGCADGLSDVTEQVDTAVAGAVGRVRRVEPLHHLRLGLERPLSARLLLAGGRGSDGERDDGGRDQGREDAHAVRVRAPGVVRRRSHPACGEPPLQTTPGDDSWPVPNLLGDWSGSAMGCLDGSVFGVGERCPNDDKRSLRFVRKIDRVGTTPEATSRPAK